MQTFKVHIKVRENCCVAVCMRNLQDVGFGLQLLLSLRLFICVAFPGEKRFGCSECDKKFMRSDHLTKHLRTHRKTYNLPVVTIAGSQFEDAEPCKYHSRIFKNIDMHSVTGTDVRQQA